MTSLSSMEEVMGGAEAEVGGGARQVLHGPGERRDAAAGGGGDFANGWALLAGAIRWGGPAVEAATIAFAVVAG
jgi:hypothetical protein